MKPVWIPFRVGIFVWGKGSRMLFEKRGVVYFIRKEDQDIFKIGMTANSPEKRLSELQSSTPDKLILYGVISSVTPRELEKSMHNRFDYCRLQGEWFALSEEIVKSLIDKPEWIELRQGRRRFWYKINTGILYMDYSTLAKAGVSQSYLATLLACTDRAVFGADGTIAIEYDLAVEDFPKLSNCFKGHKKHLLLAVQKYREEESKG